MILRTLAISAFLFATCGCAPRGGPSIVAPAAQPAASGAFAGATSIGRYRFTRAEVLSSGSRDSIFRYTDGTAARVSVFRYDIPPDVKIGADSQSWTAREGPKFEQLQSVLVKQGRIESFLTAFTDTKELDIGGVTVLEHSTAIAVRVRGRLHMDFQYLYLVGGRFLKVRGTFPGESWRTSAIPNFSREVARLAHATSR